MEVTNCSDIRGNVINEIRFNVDGTVVGLLETDSGQVDTLLSHDCCVAQGYTFDPNDAKCYWTDSCLVGGEYKIVLDPENNTGALFDTDAVNSCILELEVDYLLKFDCKETGPNLKSILENLNLDITIEKVIFDESLPIPNTLETIYRETFFSHPDLAVFFDNNDNTGILLDGTEPDCQAVTQNLINQLGPSGSLGLTSTSLYSDWVKIKITIDDPEIIGQIENERIKVGIIGNSLTNFSIVVDDIKLIRNCDDEAPPQFLNSECPRFDLTRVIDNKKSWVFNEEINTRNFDLAKRETNYSINHERLSINTKEIDLLINPSLAVENDVLTFVKENPCILDPATGCTSASTTFECVDIGSLITTPVENLVEGSELLNELIDVKSRKTIRSYPTIELLFYRYNNSQEHCGVGGNSLDDETVDTFVNLIGSFWSDLIEQVVPATTIWGSSFQRSNNIFGSGSNKFKYRKSTTILCENNNIEYPSPTSGSNTNVEVLFQDITNYDVPLVPSDSIAIEVPPTSTCSLVSVGQINDGSEFVGGVTVIGGGDGPTTGSTIVITETIDDKCDLIGK